jgi:hypothetical protein
MTDTKEKGPSSSTAAPIGISDYEGDGRQTQGKSGWKERLVLVENRQTARRFFSAYAQTWIGLSPIWLMGEALTRGAKVGNKFKKGSIQLKVVANDIRDAVSTSTQDIIVIIDDKLGQGNTETGQVAEVIKAAGLALPTSLIHATLPLNSFHSLLQAKCFVGSHIFI